MAEAQESASALKGSDTKAIGLIGAILVSGVEAIAFPEEMDGIKQATLASVPFFSAIIARTISWLWDCIKPQNAEKIALRRTLRKKRKLKPDYVIQILQKKLKKSFKNCLRILL